VHRHAQVHRRPTVGGVEDSRAESCQRNGKGDKDHSDVERPLSGWERALPIWRNATRTVAADVLVVSN
jgi:hypothetical protein